MPILSNLQKFPGFAGFGSTQYNRNEITPTAFLSLQQSYETYKLSRLIDANNINKSIINLFLKSKSTIAANDDAFFKNGVYDNKETTSSTHVGRITIKKSKK